jgi:hypothetical protein
VLAVGDINKIVVNTQSESSAELVLACQNGLFFANVSVDEDEAGVLCKDTENPLMKTIVATKSSFANFFTIRKKRNQSRINAYTEMDNNYKEKRGHMKITLTGEKYLLGKRISQVAPIDPDIFIE